ncbi:MAG TPA: hypothetical protein VHB21_16820, partial [Minicystis sp.]|nr:hypothetical protein [Minicystis sp.]
SAPAPEPTALAAAPAPAASAADDAADVDPVHGVEVAAVEFGERMGTIFYVPSGEGAANATTTVGWLAEDPADQEQP